MSTTKRFKRIQLFEFEDLDWFPDVIRTGGLDYLRYFLIRSEIYKPLIPLIYKTLKATGENKIIDLCSGGGGYIEQIYQGLNKLEKDSFSITLTDKFPNTQTYQLIKERTAGKIDYCDYSVDVFNVPEKLKGFRTLFSAVHHFKPNQVKAILQNAIDANAPVGFFDGSGNRIIAIIGLLIIHPISFFLFTPFFKPFKWSRLFFTYIIPLIPLYTMWDGFVSILRLYQPRELNRIANMIDNDYIWEYGKTKNRFGIQAAYLIGRPRN